MTGNSEWFFNCEREETRKMEQRERAAEIIKENKKMNEDRVCMCGSGKLSLWRYDARGIALCRTCDSCHDAQMRKYRPEVLNDPNYWADEPIEEDD